MDELRLLATEHIGSSSALRALSGDPIFADCECLSTLVEVALISGIGARRAELPVEENDEGQALFRTLLLGFMRTRHDWPSAMRLCRQVGEELHRTALCAASRSLV